MISDVIKKNYADKVLRLREGGCMLRSMNDAFSETIEELIYRRRQQVWIHSIIYYEFDQNLIDDSTWSKWATELDELQKMYPEESKRAMYYDIFRDFDPSTGHNLPLRDSKMLNKARYLINLANRKGW